MWPHGRISSDIFSVNSWILKCRFRVFVSTCPVFTTPLVLLRAHEAVDRSPSQVKLASPRGWGRIGFPDDCFPVQPIPNPQNRLSYALSLLPYIVHMFFIMLFFCFSYMFRMLFWYVHVFCWWLSYICFFLRGTFPFLICFICFQMCSFAFQLFSYSLLLDFPWLSYAWLLSFYLCFVVMCFFCFPHALLPLFLAC